MKAVVFFLSVFLCLLCRGNAVYAHGHDSHSSHSSTHGLPKRQHAKLSNISQDNSVIDDADLDLDEDHLKGHDNDDGSRITFPAERYSLANRWYLTFCSLTIVNNYNRSFKAFLPLYGDSSPIYIKQRVLKI